MPRPSRHEVTQARWERLRDVLPGKVGDPGRSGADNRTFVNGVMGTALGSTLE